MRASNSPLAFIAACAIAALVLSQAAVANGNMTGTPVSPDAVTCVYYDDQGRALQQEIVTTDIRTERLIANDPSIPDQEAPTGGATGVCPGKCFLCIKPGGVRGCCGTC